MPKSPRRSKASRPFASKWPHRMVKRGLDGHHHPMFARLLKAAASRMANGVPPSIWIAGPAGSGKTHGAHMVAKALNLPWHYNGALSMPHELLGVH
jgi:hypothetical protein